MTYARRGATALALTLSLSAAIALPADAAVRRQPVDLRFTAVAGTTPVECGRPIDGLGVTRATAQLMDLRFYVSDVRLIRRDGRAVRLKLHADSAYRVTRGKAGVTLIDLEDGSGACADGTRGTNAHVRGTVRRGRYVGVRWTVGVPSALNHTDAPGAPAPLNSAAMSWSWQSGRKFAKIEVTDPAATWPAPSFYVHLGSADCRGNPATGQTVKCLAANRATVRLPRLDTRRQQVALDVAALLAGNDVRVNGGGAPGCMSEATDPECGPVFRALGVGREHAGAQSVFRAIDR